MAEQKPMNGAFQIACEKLQGMVTAMPKGKKLVGEIHRCTDFQSVIDVISRNRADLTMIFSEKVEDNLNVLSQLREFLSKNKEVVIGVFSYKEA